MYIKPLLIWIIKLTDRNWNRIYMTQSNRSPASMRRFTLIFMLPDSAFILIAAQIKPSITPIAAQPNAFPIYFDWFSNGKCKKETKIHFIEMIKNVYKVSNCLFSHLLCNLRVHKSRNEWITITKPTQWTVRWPKWLRVGAAQTFHSIMTPTKRMQE